MDRKSAIAAAGTVALTLTATGVAIAANMGLLSQKTSSDLGQLSASVPPPATAEFATGALPDPEVVTIYQDVPVPARSAAADDYGDDGFEVENEDREDEDHADEDHETEDHTEDEEEDDD